MPDWLSHLGNNLESSTSPAVELFSGGPVQVPKQVKFRGDAPVIPNELADTRGSGLGAERVLHEINVLMNTRYNMETPSIKDLITSYISEEADFGTIFGHLRAWWAEFEPNRFFPSLQSLILYWKAKDEEQRAEAITGDVITHAITFPRRVWDLYSNRVVPYWAVMDRAKGLPPGWEKDSQSRQIWPVSHSWMPENERQNVSTPVNDYQWPVPIPDGISLDNVRIELLNIGAEYVWLDVLCLRQSGSQEMEQTRLEEWKLDVPTIGSIYYYASQSISTVTRLNARTIIYYSGLGRAFVVGDLKSPRHWLNRAWTLQETPGIRHTNRNLPKMDIAAGWTPYSPKRTKRARRNRPPTDDERRASTFFQSLDLVTNRGDIIGILANMAPRASVNPIDKIAGLAFLLGLQQLPIYSPSEDAEHAWQRLLDFMPTAQRGILLFMYPAPGCGPRICTPTWDQVLNGAQLSRTDNSDGPWANVSVPVGNNGLFYMRGPYFEGVHVSGFSCPSPDHGVRRGRFTVTVTRDAHKQVHTFEAITPSWHQQPIPDEHVYVLLSSRNFQHWIVGTRKEGSTDNVIEKVSVLQTSVLEFHSTEEEDRILRFRDLTEYGVWKFA